MRNGMSKELFACMRSDWAVDTRIRNISWRKWLITTRAAFLKTWWIEKLNKEQG